MGGLFFNADKPYVWGHGSGQTSAGERGDT
jgi:hypothetical protein